MEEAARLHTALRIALGWAVQAAVVVGLRSCRISMWAMLAASALALAPQERVALPSQKVEPLAPLAAEAPGLRVAQQPLARTSQQTAAMAALAESCHRQAVTP